VAGETQSWGFSIAYTLPLMVSIAMQMDEVCGFQCTANA
jgi:hypothetical protein